MTSKKLLSALLALVFALSLFTALPVAAEGTVTATANGTAIQSGDTIPAVSTLVFTLPNAIADLATVTFEEIQKGKAASGWATRLFDGEVSGNTLTVDFALGDLAMNSQYRFTFPGVAEPFTFVTAATADSYYIYDNFDRYQENNSIAAAGTDATELDAPWWLGKKQYSRVVPSFVKENGDTVLRITSGGADTSNDMFGSVSYDNAYAPAVTGLESHKTVTEVEFTVQGNASSVFEIGGIIIKTTDGQTGLYYRRTGYVNGSGFNGYADRPSIDERITSLTYPVAAPTDQKVRHTIKFIQTSDCEWPSVKTFHKLWFDGIEVPLPGGEILVSLEATEMKEDPVNYSGATGLAHLFSATNNWATSNEQPGISVRTIMDIHSYKYGPVDVKVTVADGAAANSKAITFTNNSGEDINNAVIVLAVYTNGGKTFVGFDGLTENISVENAESVTVTRTVANAAAGNTYKVIILNSKANLQPICNVASGEIG